MIFRFKSKKELDEFIDSHSLKHSFIDCVSNTVYTEEDAQKKKQAERLANFRKKAGIR